MGFKKLITYKIGKYIPDSVWIQLLYLMKFKRFANLHNPETFNEKLQWLKLHNRQPEYTMMVDKYRVRDYIKEKLGEQYLIPLLGVWNNPDEIDFKKLPERFVLKCNHNSGLGMCICKDKSKLDIKKVKENLNNGLRQNYYLTSREWPYKDVTRKIVCEQYIENTKKTDEPIEDYKVMCFNGKVKLIELHKGRFTDHYTQDFYDINWVKTNYWQVGDPVSKDISPKPFNFDKMIEFSEKISQGFPFLRVDWYENNNKLYFGEITFYDGSGLVEWGTPEMDEEIGEWIDLSKSMNN